MHDVLKNPLPGSFVLELGCSTGSFSADATAAYEIRIDRDPGAKSPNFVHGNAACLPFLDRTFAAVISNDSLEHFDDLAGALREIARVIRPDGALLIAVPDASTLTDKL